MNNLLDTFLNLTVFAFIGLLVWLYFRPLPSDKENKRDTENPSRENEDLVRSRESENA